MLRPSTRLFFVAGAIACALTSARAQIVTLGDVIAQLTLLDSQVTLQGQVVATLQGAVDAQTGAIVSVQADVSALQSTTVTLDGAVAALAVSDATQAGAIAQLQADAAANVAVDAGQDGAIAAIDVRLTVNDAVDAAQTGQIGQLQTDLATNTAIDAAQDGAIAGLDVRLTANDATDTRQDGDIAGLDVRLTANEATDIRQDGDIAGLQAGLAANDQRDDGQDQRLDYHDVVFAEHDVRITLAQGTADTALAAVGQLRSDVDAGRAGVVRVDSAGNLTVGGGLGGTSVSFAGTSGDRRLTGVADGIAANDAATVGQMQAGDAAVLGAANSYTDTSVASLTGDIDRLFETLVARDADLRSELDAAAAGAAALAGMPQAFVPGQGMVAVGIGGRGGEMAVAVGFGKAFAAPHTPVIRAGAAIDSKRGQVTYNAGVGFHF